MQHNYSYLQHLISVYLLFNHLKYIYKKKENIMAIIIHFEASNITKLKNNHNGLHFEICNLTKNFLSLLDPITWHSLLLLFF